MLQEGKNKRLIADLQSNYSVIIYQNTVLYRLYSTHGDHIWPRGLDIQHSFTILSLCQRLNTGEAK